MFSFAKKFVDKLEGINSHEPDIYYKNTLSRNNGYGLRVMHVEPDSLAAKLGFEAWFDYIVGIEGHDLPVPLLRNSPASYQVRDDGSFSCGTTSIEEQARMVDFDMVAQELATIASSPNPNVNFEIWSAKGGVLRTISVPLGQVAAAENPTIQSGALKLARKFGRVGLTVQAQHLNSASFVWKVLTTLPGSPAFRALLVPQSDYIIGCDSAFPTDENTTGLLAGGGESLLGKTIANYYKLHLETLRDDKVPVVLIVYNHDYDITRPVTVCLTRSWCLDGKKGLLGCDVGYGLLHRLPVVVGKFDAGANVLTDNMYHNDEDYSYKFEKQNPHESSERPNVSVPVVATTKVATISATDLHASTEVYPKPQPQNGPEEHPKANVSADGTTPGHVDSVPVHSALTEAAISEGQPEPSKIEKNDDAEKALTSGSVDVTSYPVVEHQQPPQQPPTGPQSPQAPQQSPLKHAPLHFPPAEPLSQGQLHGPPVIAPALDRPVLLGAVMTPKSPKQHGRRRKHPEFTNLNALADIMNEELTKSKESDYQMKPGTLDLNLPPPPKSKPQSQKPRDSNTFYDSTMPSS